MEYRSSKGFTGFGQLGILLAFLGAGFVLASIIQLIFAMQMMPAGKSITDTTAMMKALLDPRNVGLARAMQVISTLLIMFVPAVTWSIIVNGKNKLWLGFSTRINLKQVLIAFFIMYAAAAVASPLADFSKYVVAHFPSIDSIAKKMEATYAEQAAALSNLKSVQEYIVALFIMAFFPAMFEEVFFRGAMQSMFIRWWKKPMLAIVVTSLIFSFIHMSIYLFLSRALLGFALGLMFYKTKNIWINIIAHFLNNAFALTALYFYQLKTGKVDLDKIDPSMHWSVGLIGLIALIVLFKLLAKFSVKNVLAIEEDEKALLYKNIL